MNEIDKSHLSQNGTFFTGPDSAGNTIEGLVRAVGSGAEPGQWIVYIQPQGVNTAESLAEVIYNLGILKPAKRDLD